MKDNTYKDCPICSKLNNYEGASLLHNQELPKAAEKLEGFSEVNQLRSGTHTLRCPFCETMYTLEVDAEFMVHDLELKRICSSHDI